MKRKTYFFYIKVVICIVAVINLAALFIFHYGPPSFLTGGKDPGGSAADSQTGSADGFSDGSSGDSSGGSFGGSSGDSSAAAEAGYAFIFEPEALTYDGSTELDLLEGVTLTDPDGASLNTEIYARISTGASISEKVIQYSADTDAGQITASRTLHLKNYSGPSITLPDPLPDTDEAMLDSILTVMADDGTFLADDGYGNDITSSVSFTYNRNESLPAEVHYIFSVTNLFNDSASAEAILTITDPRPLVTLTENAITIPKNSSLSPESYIASAVDTDGESLLQSVAIEGKVNIREPGVYTLVYTATGKNGRSSLPQRLVVTVE